MFELEIADLGTDELEPGVRDIEGLMILVLLPVGDKFVELVLGADDLVKLDVEAEDEEKASNFSASDGLELNRLDN